MSCHHAASVYATLLITDTIAAAMIFISIDAAASSIFFDIDAD